MLLTHHLVAAAAAVNIATVVYVDVVAAVVDVIVAVVDVVAVVVDVAAAAVDVVAAVVDVAAAIAVDNRPVILLPAEITTLQLQSQQRLDSKTACMCCSIVSFHAVMYS